MRQSPTKTPNYFSRLLGAAPSGLPVLQKPRDVPSALSGDVTMNPWSGPAIDRNATTARPNAQILPLNEAQPAKAAPGSTIPASIPVANRPVNAGSLRPTPQGDIAPADPIVTEHVRAARATDPTTPSAETKAAEARPEVQPALGSFLDQVFERTSQQYREDPVADSAVPSTPHVSTRRSAPLEAGRVVQVPSVAQPPAANPPIEIGHIEIRLQPPTSPARTPSSQRTAKGSLTRGRYVHGLRQS